MCHRERLCLLIVMKLAPLLSDPTVLLSASHTVDEFPAQSDICEQYFSWPDILVAQRKQIWCIMDAPSARLQAQPELARPDGWAAQKLQLEITVGSPGLN